MRQLLDALPRFGDPRFNVDRIDTEEGANRLARAIASDISLYNEKKITEGLEKDSFYEILIAELEEGLNHYRGRVDPDLFARTNFFNRAIIDVILYRKSHIASEIW